MCWYVQQSLAACHSDLTTGDTFNQPGSPWVIVVWLFTEVWRAAVVRGNKCGEKLKEDNMWRWEENGNTSCEREAELEGMTQLIFILL